MRRPLPGLTALIAVTLLVGGSPPQREAGADASLEAATADTEAAAHLDNLVRAGQRIWSGAEPKHPAAFESLVRMGVRTVISVDGATPDVGRAKAAGLRYIHIPVRYDRIDRSAQLSLVRAMRETEGGVYIHCHHGVHRGPAAAALACMIDEAMPTESAMQLLHTAGTSADYTGLWETVAKFELPDDATELPELSSIAEVEPLRAAMARIDRTWDRVRSSLPEESTADADASPELAADLLLLTEEFRELARLNDQPHDKPWQSWLSGAEADASAARRLAGQQSSAAELSMVLQSLQTRCRDCHQMFRDH